VKISDFFRRTVYLNKRGNQIKRISSRLLTNLEESLKKGELDKKNMESSLRQLKDLEKETFRMKEEQKLINLVWNFKPH
jgi:Glu-tRNA(Gln) amidotransferase subunit E-like FAD-binding protein